MVEEDGGIVAGVAASAGPVDLVSNSSEVNSSKGRTVASRARIATPVFTPHPWIIAIVLRFKADNPRTTAVDAARKVGTSAVDVISLAHPTCNPTPSRFQ